MNPRPAREFKNIGDLFSIVRTESLLIDGRLPIDPDSVFAVIEPALVDAGFDRVKARAMSGKSYGVLCSIPGSTMTVPVASF